MYILLWILFGALIGWIASILTHNNNRMGLLANIVVGLIGAVIGGLIADLAGWGAINVFTWSGTFISIVGAIILLSLINLFNRNRR
ncbi:MAG TPA: GlsB/YeaQ/YmgE family stress response membrane protein [Bacilli bacterium]|nr:GlsB/YeaQ/YmgE family stress response membrane protein [Bacilli bacterium]